MLGSPFDFLESKLRPPRGSAQGVPRTALIERLNRAAGTPIVVCFAGPARGALATADGRQPLPGACRAQGRTRPAPHGPRSLAAHYSAASRRPIVTTSPDPDAPLHLGHARGSRRARPTLLQPRHRRRRCAPQGRPHGDERAHQGRPLAAVHRRADGQRPILHVASPRRARAADAATRHRPLRRRRGQHRGPPARARDPVSRLRRQHGPVGGDACCDRERRVRARPACCPAAAWPGKPRPRTSSSLASTCRPSAPRFARASTNTARYEPSAPCAGATPARRRSGRSPAEATSTPSAASATSCSPAPSASAGGSTPRARRRSSVPRSAPSRQRSNPSHGHAPGAASTRQRDRPARCSHQGGRGRCRRSTGHGIFAA